VQGEAWGPVLVVCKLKDLDAFEAGLTVSLFGHQVEVMPYYGSDSDRIALRSA